MINTTAMALQTNRGSEMSMARMTTLMVTKGKREIGCGEE